MVHLKRILNTLLLMTTLALLLSGCYYDVEEELYPDSFCDTTVVTYTQTIAPLMNQYCTSCHSGSTPSASIDLSTYDNVKTYALNGSLYGSVSWNPDYSAMPKNGNQLDDCSQNRIKVWIERGLPN